ncbi:MAG: sugar transferase [Bacillota bacterium]
MCCFFKRLFDIGLSLILMFVFSPLIFGLATIILIKVGYPIVFRQIRPGYKNENFVVYKFRTMTDAKDSSGNLLPDERRLTKLGNFLRKASLDELPQLWNVIKGEMSFVGPRPLLVEYLPYYSKEQLRRHDVKPGITGWAQINGRNAITWKKKFELDVWYVDNQSFILDMKIMFLTVKNVFCRKNINFADGGTEYYFRGE